VLRATVSAVTGSVGLFLALVTLFTSEQVRRREFERERVGGPHARSLKNIRTVVLGLLAVTSLSVATMGPLLWDVVNTCCSGALDPILALFPLIWLLLLALVVWQASLLLDIRRRLDSTS
jgi:hypothetical protein